MCCCGQHLLDAEREWQPTSGDPAALHPSRNTVAASGEVIATQSKPPDCSIDGRRSLQAQQQHSNFNSNPKLATKQLENPDHMGL